MNITPSDAIKEVFPTFIQQEYPDEIILLDIHSYNELAQASRNSNTDKLTDAVGFGDLTTMMSDVAAFIFLLLAEKIISDGYEVTKDLMFQYLKEHEQRIRELVDKGRPISKFDELLAKIYNFLSK